MTQASSYWLDPLPSNGTQLSARLGLMSVGKHGNKDITSNTLIASLSHNIQPWLRVSYFIANGIDEPETISNNDGIQVEGEFDYGTGVGFELFAYRSMKMGLYGYFGINLNVHRYTNLDSPIPILGPTTGYHTNTSEHTTRTFGIGGQYYITNKFFIQAEHMIYNNESNVDIDGQSIGLGLRF